MLECRTITEAETDRFLDILCTVFHLDKDRAASIFYSEPFFDLGRKWALFDDGQMKSILTVTPLEFGFGSAVGVAGVATLEENRGRGYAQRLLEESLDKVALPALLFAHDTVVYHRVGFEVLDVVLRGDVKAVDHGTETDALGFEEVSRRYQEWQAGSPNRLIRDERRWRHWQWVYRSCSPVGEQGYVCYEPLLCREAVLESPMEAWPVSEGTEWLGLQSLSKELGVPLESAREELIYMGRGLTEIPHMFMTDQF